MARNLAADAWVKLEAGVGLVLCRQSLALTFEGSLMRTSRGRHDMCHEAAQQSRDGDLRRLLGGVGCDSPGALDTSATDSDIFGAGSGET
jgi:hypothetical protein